MKIRTNQGRVGSPKQPAKSRPRVLAQAILLEPFLARAGEAGFCLPVPCVGIFSTASHGTQQEVGVAGRHPGGSVAHNLARPTSSSSQVGDAQQVRRIKILQYEGSGQEGFTSTQEAGAAQGRTRPEEPSGQQDSEAPRGNVSRSGHGGSPCQSAQVAGGSHHVGRGRRDVPTVLEALKKAQSRAQERPVSERIQSTQSFIDRKQK